MVGPMGSEHSLTVSVLQLPKPLKSLVYIYIVDQEVDQTIDANTDADK